MAQIGTRRGRQGHVHARGRGPTNAAQSSPDMGNHADPRDQLDRRQKLALPRAVGVLGVGLFEHVDGARR